MRPAAPLTKIALAEAGRGFGKSLQKNEIIHAKSQRKPLGMQSAFIIGM